MCGRYGRRADKQRIAEWMPHDTGVFDDSYFAPMYDEDREGQDLSDQKWEFQIRRDHTP